MAELWVWSYAEASSVGLWGKHWMRGLFIPLRPPPPPVHKTDADQGESPSPAQPPPPTTATAAPENARLNPFLVGRVAVQAPWSAAIGSASEISPKRSVPHAAEAAAGASKPLS